MSRTHDHDKGGRHSCSGDHSERLETLAEDPRPPRAVWGELILDLVSLVILFTAVGYAVVHAFHWDFTLATVGIVLTGTAADVIRKWTPHELHMFIERVEILVFLSILACVATGVIR